MTDFVELHAASAFSFLNGASDPEALVAEAARQGMSSMALCDRNGVYGIPRFHKACRAAGMQAIVGAGLVLADGSELPVLVAEAQGYANLCRMLSEATQAYPKGQAVVSDALIERHSTGLVALTGDPWSGPLGRALAQGSAEAEICLKRLRRLFPQEGQLQVELQHHLRREDTQRVQMLVDLAASQRLPTGACNGVRYAARSDRPVLDVFSCLRHGKDLDSAGRLLSENAERHLKNAEGMATIFTDWPEALRGSVALAERLEFSFDDPGYRFPSYPVPDGETMDSFLRKLVWFGAEQRYRSLSPKVRRQLEHELGIIGRLGFSGYFLIVWDIVNYCREANIMVQGRGSAANSAVCYSLGITAVDPIACGLLFERFLSEGRQGWPDIDLDLPSGERREQVIQEVYRRYGRHGAAMTANVITYRGKSAVREIGKALGFPRAQLDRFSKLYAGGDYKETLELEEHLAKAGILPSHPRHKALTGLYSKIHGLPRHLGQHSGGMIICAGMLDAVVPLEPASMPGRVVAQWDKDDCEDLGIVKVDLLGLGMMAAMQDAFEMIRSRGGEIDLASMPKDDPATFKLMQNADTIGVFQIESRAQQATLPRMKPKTFYDVAIEVAIIRPGPIQGELVHPYLARRQGREPVDYLDERLRPVLERTLGVPLYQEQMLKIAMIMADFDGSEAEELRRALNFHRNPERLQHVQAKLRGAMERKGISAAVIEKIVQATGSFALYGFPESHAISFALLAYGSTYLKAHHPAAFYAALLNNQPMGFYSPATLIQDARRRGLRFRSPCVAASAVLATVEDDKVVQLGLSMIRGLGREAAEAVVAAREHDGPFADAADLQRRTRLDGADLRLLAQAGALRSFGKDRRRALWESALLLDLRDGELPLEAGGMEPGDEEPPVEAMSLFERIQADYATLGLTTGKHPMALYRSRLAGVVSAEDLPKRRALSRVEVAGAVICRQRPGTARGFVFVSLEDETGIINTILAPDFFEKHRMVVTQEAFLRIQGRLQKADGVIHVRAETVSSLFVEPMSVSRSHDFH